MQPTYLPIAVKSSALKASELLYAIERGTIDFEYAFYLSESYRRMAVGFLLMSGTPNQFLAYLHRSSRSFLHFLREAPDEIKITSRTLAYFDAVACDDAEGAHGIFASSRDTWNPQKEYEDDFLYMWFLMGIWGETETDDQLQDMLERYEEVLEGADDVRFDICASLLTRGEEEWGNSVGAFIEMEQDRVAALRGKDQLNPDEAATTANVSIELLALLRIGERRGLPTEEAYPLAPAPSRMLGLSVHPSADAWKTLEIKGDLQP